MPSEGTHLIPSDLALAMWSLLVNRLTASCCRVVALPVCDHMHLWYLYTVSSQQQVPLDSLTYFQQLHCVFPAPSLTSLEFNQI